jgi:hypothetical protein
MSFVYVMTGGPRHVKIGISIDVEKRLHGIQTGCPFRVELVKTWQTDRAQKIEIRAHEILRKYRSAGEWFDVPPAVAVMTVEALVDRPRFQLKAIVFCRNCRHSKSMAIPDHGARLRCTKCNKRDHAHVVTF